MRRFSSRELKRGIETSRAHATPFVFTRARILLLAPVAMVLAFSCSGGDPTDNLPSDCDAYLAVSRECLQMDDARIQLMRESLHSRLVAAVDSEKRAGVINECARGASQLSKVCHGR